MEEIQAAIAKARAARSAVLSGQVAPPPAAPVAPAAGPVPLPLTSRVGAAPAAPVAAAPPPAAAPAPAADPAAAAAAAEAVAARWQALPSFTPVPAQLARNHVVTLESGADAVPFDQLRTRLLQQLRANNWRRVAITSPGPGCGKSTTALNLALSIARQTDLRCILAEMDLRRPSLARMLGLRQPQRFARVLEGRERFADQAARIGANMAFSTATGAQRNPAELLHSPTVAEALASIEADYDPAVVLFDMAPVLMVDDAMAVMGQMDCALIVAAAETTRVAEIDRCEREVASETSVLGVVLNKCRYMGASYGYDYYGS